jgi:hypothetical protein
MNRYDNQVNWYQILIEMAECELSAEPVHPTIHVGPNMHEALIDAGCPPEDLTLVTPGGQYEDSLVALTAAAGDVSHVEAIAALNSMTEPGQELDMTRDGAGGWYFETGGKWDKTRYDGPPLWEPRQQNDMRPKHVDRDAVKAARKVARINRRKRGKR